MEMDYLASISNILQKKKKKDSVISEKNKNYWVTWCLHWWDRKQ